MIQWNTEIFDRAYRGCGRSRSFKIDTSRCWHSPTDLGITRFQMRTTRMALGEVLQRPAGNLEIFNVFLFFLRKLISSYIAALALLAFLAGPSFANFLLKHHFLPRLAGLLTIRLPVFGNGTGKNIGRQPSRVFMLGLAGMASNMHSFGSLSFADPFWCVAVWLYFRTLALHWFIHPFICLFI